MGIEDGPLSYTEARQTFEEELQHYLGGGGLLPTCGGLSNGEVDKALAGVAGSVYREADPAAAVAAAWAVFDKQYSE